MWLILGRTLVVFFSINQLQEASKAPGLCTNENAQVWTEMGNFVGEVKAFLLTPCMAPVLLIVCMCKIYKVGFFPKKKPALVKIFSSRAILIYF